MYSLTEHQHFEPCLLGKKISTQNLWESFIWSLGGGGCWDYDNIQWPETRGSEKKEETQKAGMSAKRRVPALETLLQNK